MGIKSGVCDVLTLYYLTEINVRIFLRFVKMSANILQRWRNNIICIFPNSFSVLTPFPSMTHACLSGPDTNS